MLALPKPDDVEITHDDLEITDAAEITDEIKEDIGMTDVVEITAAAEITDEMKEDVEITDDVESAPAAVLEPPEIKGKTGASGPASPRLPAPKLKPRPEQPASPDPAQTPQPKDGDDSLTAEQAIVERWIDEGLVAFACEEGPLKIWDCIEADISG